MPTADIYTRLSRETPDQTSTSRQESDCRKLADLRGSTVGQVHEDVDFSAYKAVVRPGYDALRERVRAGAVQEVIFWKIDRLARNTREFLSFVDLCEKHDVGVVSVNEQFDTSSPIGRVMVTILAAFAELESATIGVRVRSARRLEVSQGRAHMGGRRKFGYTRAMVLVPEEAEAIREAARDLLTGTSSFGIAKRWREAGLTQVGGGCKWRAGDVSRLIRSPHLAGLRQHNGALTDGNWEPILDRATHEALLVLRRPGPRNRQRVNLLTGVALCGLCGASMTCRLDRRGARVYVCRGDGAANRCGRVAIMAKPLDGLVTRLVLEALDSPANRRALQLPSDGATRPEKGILAALRQVETRMAAAGEAYAAGRLPLAAFEAATEALQRQADQYAEELAAAGRLGILAGVRDVNAEWERRDIAWRARLVQGIFAKIVVHPASGRGPKVQTDRLELVRRA